MHTTIRLPLLMLSLLSLACTTVIVEQPGDGETDEADTADESETDAMPDMLGDGDGDTTGDGDGDGDTDTTGDDTTGDGTTGDGDGDGDGDSDTDTTGDDCCYGNPYEPPYGDDMKVPGCVIPELEACVCAIDTYCCEVNWDLTCVGHAVEDCGWSCE